MNSLQVIHSGNLGKVYLGDDQPCDVVEKGEVQIKLNGSVWKLMGGTSQT
jgi:hypothetical protein